MALQWRSFDFFEKQQITEESIQSLDITCTVTGGGNIFWGQANGNITITDTSFGRISVFSAYQKRITHLLHNKPKNILLSIGEEEGFPTLKVWNLDKIQKNGAPPALIKSHRVQHGVRQFPVTSIAILPNLTQIAIGLEDGVVLLIKGDISKDRFTKARLIYEASSPITGLEFSCKERAISLFITTLSKVLVVSISSKENPVLLDEHGCEIGNTILTPSEYPPELVIGRKEAVYFYNEDGRGPCFIIGGEKSFMKWYHSYLLVISGAPILATSEILSPNSPSNSPMQFGQSSSQGTVLTIYDLKSKYIAYKSSFGQEIFDPKRGIDVGEPILDAIIGATDIFVITKSRKLYRLTESDVDTKLETLYSQNLFTLAINIMLMSSSNSFHSNDVEERQNLNPNSSQYPIIMDIHRRYADHLYSKSEFAFAVSHYILTIPHLSPSYVILKFVDPSHICYLTQYLQALLDSKVASQNHINLLLNCYSKLKDDKNLGLLVSKGGFDIENGIRICRAAGYFDHALNLSKAANMHYWVISILFEDLHAPKDVLKYIAELDGENINNAMKRYGGSIIKELPKESTDILVMICSARSAYPEDFLPFFVDSKTWCIEFLERVIANRFSDASAHDPHEIASRSLVSNTLFELYLENYLLSNKHSVQSNICLDFLTKHVSILDLDQALILCKKHEHDDGILFIYKKMQRFKEILDFYMCKEEYNNIMNTCQENESLDSSLWIHAINLMVQSLNIDEDIFRIIIKKLDSLKLLSPLEIIQILSTNPQINLGLIKDFIIDKISKERLEIEESCKTADKYSEEIEDMRKKTEILSTGTIVFQANRCEFCRQILDIPTTHFLCKHSYHQRCLGHSSDECPRCSPERRIVFELLKSQAQSASDHKTFLSNLDKNEDSFALIAGYFGKNVFGPIER